MLEQLRAKRRKRKARLLAFSILGTTAVLLVVVMVMSLKSCLGGPPEQRIAIAELPQEVRTSASEQAGEISFRPAPLYTAMDSEYLLTAIASSSSDEEATGTEVEKIVAYRIADGKPAWERPVNDHLAGLIVSGGHAIIYRHDDIGFGARAFSLADGSPAWDFDIPLAQNLTIASDMTRMAIAYNLTDGFRIAFYDTTNGAKSGGRMVSAAEDAYMDFSRTSLNFVGKRLLYTVDRRVGMIDLDRDSHWSESGSAPVVIASPDPANSQVYVLSWGNGADSLVLHVRDFADGNAKELDRFETSADSLVMVAEEGHLLLAYSDRREDGHYDSSVRLFRKDSRDSYVRQTVEGARVEDAMPVGGGLFILGLNRSTGNDENPVSGGELHLVNSEDGSVTEFERLRDNVEYTIRFGEDRLVLTDGGEIQRIELANSRIVRVKRCANPVLTPMFSPDYSVLCVLSEPQGNVPGNGSSRMQAVIFR